MANMPAGEAERRCEQGRIVGVELAEEGAGLRPRHGVRQCREPRLALIEPEEQGFGPDDPDPGQAALRIERRGSIGPDERSRIGVGEQGSNRLRPIAQCVGAIDPGTAQKRLKRQACAFAQELRPLRGGKASVTRLAPVIPMAATSLRLRARRVRQPKGEARSG